ncbi:hyaluronan-binding protein 2-like isoform X1 [Triplophysa dalaica]|uniref:hyaluronan-binding protein 2-like isoform X1 n=1 Tax=Triplophysa dalaica TaxID=1582913 RepID=UPI0024DFCA98|nr:hyaluronan-binding protein 2-like isoform X1 [Triplophysa dalaica]
MKLKLCLLLLFLCAIIVPAQLKKEKKGHKHGEKEHGKHGKKGRNRVHFLTAEFDTSESDDDEDPTDPNEWLLELQDVRGKCSPSPCRNGGFCEQKRDKYKCKCPEPFGGRRCERRRNVCSKGKCGVGLCLLTTSPPYYKCKCIPPFAPPNCEIPSPCTPNPCQNNGKCVKDEDDFDCVCQAEFKGRYCQVDPNDCYIGDGESYRGRVSETEDGDECLDWNSEFVLDKGPFPSVTIGGLGPHNNCRNPDGDRKPWCFIKKNKKLRWDYCDVRKCETNTTEVITTTTKPKTTTDVPRRTTSGYAFRTTTPQIGDRFVNVTGKPRTTTAPVRVTSSKGLFSTVPHHPVTIKPVNTSVTKDFLTCGKPEPKKQFNRIYGGLKSIPGAHPWQVSVQAKTKGGIFFNHVCGGTLVKPCWVLTAAHCIEKKNDYRVMVGGLNLVQNDPQPQLLLAEKVFVHEQYRETSVVYNDIALLKVKASNGECATENQLVKTACLPTEPFADGSECSISGWGATETLEHGSGHLLDAQVLLISQEACSTNKDYAAVLDSGMFCAGHLKGGVDSCQGDSGGPLTCERNQTHFVYGIVSWGDSCGEMGKPGVYTRVTKYVDWINTKIAQN